MSATTRVIIAAVGAGLLAALATPELAAKLPPGVAQILAVSIAAALHRIDATPKPPAPPGAPPASYLLPPAALMLALFCVSCSGFGPDVQEQIASDSTTILHCQNVGRACKADGGTECYTKYRACMKDGGL